MMLVPIRRDRLTADSISLGAGAASRLGGLKGTPFSSAATRATRTAALCCASCMSSSAFLQAAHTPQHHS